MSEREIGRAICHRTPYKFDKPVKENEAPPFPSAPTYDAKGWFPMMEHYELYQKPDSVLFWNVGA